jgi:hypothetical protein
MIPGMPQEPPPGTPGGAGYIPPGLPGSPEFIPGPIPGMPGSPEYHPSRRRMNSGYVGYGSRGKLFRLGTVAFVIVFLAALAFIVFVAINVFGAR